MSVAKPTDAVSGHDIRGQENYDRWELFGKASDMNVQGT